MAATLAADASRALPARSVTVAGMATVHSPLAGDAPTGTVTAAPSTAGADQTIVPVAACLATRNVPGRAVTPSPNVITSPASVNAGGVDASRDGPAPSEAATGTPATTGREPSRRSPPEYVTVGVEAVEASCPCAMSRAAPPSTAVTAETATGAPPSAMAQLDASSVPDTAPPSKAATVAVRPRVEAANGAEYPADRAPPA